MRTLMIKVAPAVAVYICCSSRSIRNRLLLHECYGREVLRSSHRLIAAYIISGCELLFGHRLTLGCHRAEVHVHVRRWITTPTVMRHCVSSNDNNHANFLKYSLIPYFYTLQLCPLCSARDHLATTATCIGCVGAPIKLSSGNRSSQ